MQYVKIVQAVVLLCVMACAASCAVSKDYSAKLFGPRMQPAADSQQTALHFLDMDPENKEKDTVNWVSTDIIRGKDSAQSTAALDKLANTLPVKKDSVNKAPEKTEPLTVPAGPWVKTMNNGDVRTKRVRE